MKGTVRDSRGATLRDTLSHETLQKLTELRSQLGGKAKSVIGGQLQAGSAHTAQKKQAAATHSKPDSRGPKSTKPLAGVAAYPSQTPKPSPTKGGKISTADQGQTATPTFEYWELPQGASVREPPPQTVTDADLAAFRATLSAGGGEAADENLPELFAVVGLDFGTSSSKVIVRFPYEAGELTVAVPAPAHCTSDGQPHLWKTVLWLRPDGEFVGWPEPGSVVLHALKQGVMTAGAADDIVPGQFKGLSVSKFDAAAAYLAFVIRYTRGWLRLHRPELFRGRFTRWLLNLGLPAERADDGPLSSTYRQVAATALLCANFSDQLDIEITKLFLTEDAVVAAGGSEEGALELGIGVFPETVAEAVGFAKSKLTSLDLYLMVDVGASTLDLCTFRLHRSDQGADQYALQCGMVRPLGVEAMHWYFDDGRSEADFLQQCDHSLWGVVWPTRRDKDPNAQCWTTGHELSVFLVGGGANNPIHREAVERLTPWLQKHVKNNGIRLVQQPMPNALQTTVPVADFGRLAVAWGLSYPDDQIGKVLPPSQSTDVPWPVQSELPDRYISKDQM